MKLIGLALLVLALTFAACSKAAPTSAPAATENRGTSGGGGSTIGATSAPVTAPAAATDALFLEITQPKDESVVRQAALTVGGETAPDAVVSVNGQSAEVDADGNFAAIITLEQGPNSIEVITSDFSGNQQFKLISVIYTP